MLNYSIDCVGNVSISDSENHRHLLDIQSSIFVLALDNSNSLKSDNQDIDSLDLNEMNHGGGSRVNSANRWFDKVLQVCCLLFQCVVWCCGCAA